MRFTYSEVIELGFIRTDDHDEVFFNEYGYDYFIVHKEITYNLGLDWNPKNQKVTLYFSDDDGFVKGKIKIKSKKKLKKFIKATELVSDFESVKSFFKIKK